MVAIKVRTALGHHDDHRLGRFLREARVIGRLSHPSIVPIYHVGQYNDLTYIVTQYIDGQSLASLHREAPLPPREAARILAEVADAVHYAHQLGIIHRDIKPSNIMLNAEGRPLLMDFGLARAAEDEASLTSEGQFLGTPAYMSPEQAAHGSHAVGPHSDVYSLGATLFALVTGRPPFHGASAMETVRRLLYEEPPRPRDVNPAVDRDLEAICLKAIARDPARRYATARELAEDLRRFLAGRPILARPAGPLERARRWARRHLADALRRLAFALPTVIGVLILALLARQPGAWPEAPRPLGAPPVPVSSAAPGPAPSRPREAVPVDLADALNDLGRLYRDLDRPAQAEAAYRRSAAILEQLSRAHPEAVAYRRGLAEAYRNLGELLRAGVRSAEADAFDQAAHAIVRALPAGGPRSSPASSAVPGPSPEAGPRASTEGQPPD